MKVERRKKIRLGELLVEQKVINEEQLNKALAEQKRTGRWDPLESTCRHASLSIL